MNVYDAHLKRVTLFEGPLDQIYSFNCSYHTDLIQSLTIKNAQLSSFHIHNVSWFLEFKNIVVESIGGTTIFFELVL